MNPIFLKHIECCNVQIIIEMYVKVYFEQKKKAKKITFFWLEFHFLGAKNAKILKNKKLIKKVRKKFPRYMYLGGFGKFLVIFVQRYLFYPC